MERAMRDVSRPYAELVVQLELLRGIAERYFHLLELYQRHGVVSVDVILPEVKDAISKEISRIVMDHTGYNITQVTEELRARTGSASRRVVRARLQELNDLGVVTVEGGSRGNAYRISDRVIAKWSQVLGLSMFGDRTSDKHEAEEDEHQEL